MKRKVNLIFPLMAMTLLVSVACVKNSKNEDFEAMKKALTFEENDTYTGYRLSMDMTSLETSEVIYSFTKSVSIDKENTIMHASETTVVLSDDVEATDGKLTTTNDYYYDVASKYTLQADGSYLQEDGEVDQNPPIVLNPTEDCFSDMDYQKSGNSYEINGKIVSSKANDLFGSEKLNDIKNATIYVSFYDAILEKVSFEYEINNLKVSQQLTISYNAVSLVLPV